MLVVYPLLPENTFPLLQFQSLLHTWYLLSAFSCFTLLIFLLYQKPKNIFLHNTHILSCYLEIYLAFLFQYLIQELLDFRFLLPVGRYLYFETSYKRYVHL